MFFLGIIFGWGWLYLGSLTWTVWGILLGGIIILDLLLFILGYKLIKKGVNNDSIFSIVVGVMMTGFLFGILFYYFLNKKKEKAEKEKEKAEANQEKNWYYEQMSK